VSLSSGDEGPPHLHENRAYGQKNF
jgi:hypothetical protein